MCLPLPLDDFFCVKKSVCQTFFLIIVAAFIPTAAATLAVVDGAGSSLRRSDPPLR